ncbi:neurofilament triplet m protein-like protein [Anaeramoeba flamelloides]|uniref:Neurofilament triplet m protein-like protein n=1 Tax=Anaeramoeba flamelloides TaxID=1746091 RepID=A0AAV7YQY4_9EUKA|nr:neurofilament triplet m protein-like protein [Anaeramoeba flamelloides]
MINSTNILKKVPKNKKPLGRVEIIKNQKQKKSKKGRKRDHCEAKTQTNNTLELEEHLYEKNLKGQIVDILATMKSQEYSLLSSEQKKRRRLLRNRLNAQKNRNKKKRGIKELEKKFDHLSNEHHKLNEHIVQLTAEKEQMKEELLLLRKLIYVQDKEKEKEKEKKKKKKKKKEKKKETKKQQSFLESKDSQPQQQITKAPHHGLVFKESIFTKNKKEKTKNEKENIIVKQKEGVQKEKQKTQDTNDSENILEGWYGESLDDNFLSLNNEKNTVQPSENLKDGLLGDQFSRLDVDNLFKIPNTIDEEGCVSFTELINDNKFGFSLFFIFTFLGIIFCCNSLLSCMSGNPSTPPDDNGQPIIPDSQFRKKIIHHQMKQHFFRKRSIQTLQTTHWDTNINGQETCSVNYNIIFSDVRFGENNNENGIKPHDKEEEDEENERQDDQKNKDMKKKLL